jgi:hypothetical protein
MYHFPAELEGGASGSEGMAGINFTTLVLIGAEIVFFISSINP